MRPVILALPLLILLPSLAAAQAPGSYRRSCTDINQNGSILSARCRGPGGDYETRLDTDQCGDLGVVNSSGRLTCGNARGTARPAGGPFFGGRQRQFDQDQGRGFDGGYRRPRRYDPDADAYPPPPPPRGPRFRRPPDEDDGYAPPPPPPPPPPPRRRRFDPDLDD